MAWAVISGPFIQGHNPCVHKDFLWCSVTRRAWESVGASQISLQCGMVFIDLLKNLESEQITEWDNNNIISFYFHNEIYKSAIKKSIEFSIQQDNFI